MNFSPRVLALMALSSCPAPQPPGSSRNHYIPAIAIANAQSANRQDINLLYGEHNDRIDSQDWLIVPNSRSARSFLKNALPLLLSLSRFRRGFRGWLLCRLGNWLRHWFRRLQRGLGELGFFEHFRLRVRRCRCGRRGWSGSRGGGLPPFP